MLFLRTVFLAALMVPLAAAEPLASLLDRLTKSAPAAMSFSATVKQIDYTAVIDHADESNGVIRLKRAKAGVIGVVDYSMPSPNTVHFTGGKMEKYLPKANLLEIYDYGKYSKSVDQYLSLAFGISGSDLQKNYTVKWVGEESVAGMRTTHLDLTPKDKEALKLISKIELWIPEGQTYTIQEKLSKAGSKDNLTWVYSDAKLNPGLPDSAFDFNPPAGVTRRQMK
jgi:hypothetical protein